MSVSKKIRQQIFEYADNHIELLESALEASFEDVHTFQQWVDDRLESLGASTDHFSVDSEDLKNQPAFREQFNSESDEIRLGTNVVGRFSGETDATTLLFAHADKAPVSYQHAESGRGFRSANGRLSGPGIADDVSGVTATIAALETLTRAELSPSTSVLVASIFGKQLGVGGTYGLMKRYGPADAAVYVHPAESGQGLGHLKVGSNGLYEFTIEIEGAQPPTNETHHPLYAHQGENPINIMRPIVQQLQDWTGVLSERHTHPGVERSAGTSAGLLISDIRTDNGGRPVYEMPRNCTIEAALVFPPGVSLDTVEEGIFATLNEAIEGTDVTEISIRRGDHTAESAEAPTDSPAVNRVADSIESVTDDLPEFYYGHTASDIRYPMLYWDAPTVGFGPRAGAMGESGEWIDRDEYLETICALATFLVEFDPA